jgi:hypothetical protein
LTLSVVEQKEPIKSCFRFDKLIVLDSSSSSAALPKRVSNDIEWGGEPPAAAAAAAACEAEACGPASASATLQQLRLRLRLRRLGGSTTRGA